MCGLWVLDHEGGGEGYSVKVELKICQREGRDEYGRIRLLLSDNVDIIL